MTINRAQNKVAKSRFTLPVTTVYAIIVCFACSAFQNNMWVEMGCIAVSTYLMTELNNANSLIRVYSRMLPCAFLILTMTTNFIFQNSFAMVAQLCLIAFYMLFFHAYQDRHSQGRMFYSFLFLGIVSIFFIQILYFVPVLWILMKFKIMAMSWRAFLASIIGLIVPYWFVAGYFIYIGRPYALLTNITMITKFEKLFDYTGLDIHHIITFAFIFILALTGIIHFLRHSYNDKIRTRMLYETFIIMDICCAVFIILQPHCYDTVFGMMIVNTAPLIAHFITLTRTRLTNISFYIIIIATVALTVYNIWGNSHIF